ncbi:hypothetical protein ACQPWY_24705 [Pseudonocardia xinjiangensis]|uniref:hypothetical protein n=1 Tax=Pseudonocardia xinjiangensis TaxID=75289 RepID=UPI003D919D4E
MDTVAAGVAPVSGADRVAGAAGPAAEEPVAAADVNVADVSGVAAAVARRADSGAGALADSAGPPAGVAEVAAGAVMRWTVRLVGSPGAPPSAPAALAAWMPAAGAGGVGVVAVGGGVAEVSGRRCTAVGSAGPEAADPVADVELVGVVELFGIDGEGGAAGVVVPGVVVPGAALAGIELIGPELIGVELDGVDCRPAGAAGAVDRVVRCTGASGVAGASIVVGTGGGAGVDEVAVGGGVAEVRGLRCTAGPSERDGEVAEALGGVVDVVVDLGGVAGVEGEVVLVGVVDGAAFGGVAGLLGEPGAGARCTVVLVGSSACGPVGRAPVVVGPDSEGGAGGVVAVGGGVAEVSGLRWTVAD